MVGGGRRAGGGPREIRIRYLRPPDRVTVYRQHLVHDDGRVKVTLARDLPFDPPLRIEGEVALEKGSDAVWFTFPGAWHDIGRFHRADGSLSGIYANLITPCIFEPGGDWATTDLFLDLWIPARTWEGAAAFVSPSFEPALLDETELARAEEAGALSPRLAARARDEATRLLDAARSGVWPPPVVRQWTRDRALEALGTLPSSAPSP